jgi:ABC-type uncharacterized transport system involved in gliding motility auxiliary subunit
MSNQTRALIATIAGFAAIGFLFLSLVYWALLANPPLRIDNIDLTLRILLVATIVFFAIYILVSPESVGKAAGKRSTRLTANALIASAIAIAIGIVVNILSESTVTARADWTAGQDFAISEQTKQILGRLSQNGREIRALAFTSTSADGGEAQRQATELLDEYRSYAANLRVEVVDFLRNPLRARQYGVTRNGVVVFDDGSKQQVANSITERDFTSAILRLLDSETRTVAFLAGHNERDPNNFDFNGYSQAQQALEQNNYSVISWRFVTSPTLTVDAVDVLVIAAPGNPLTDGEIGSIQGYLNSGGRALVLTDPQMPAPALASIAKLLRPYNIEPIQGVVLDLQSSYLDTPVNVVVQNYSPHPITEALRQGSAKPSLFPLSMGLRALTGTTTLTVAPIVQSSAGDGASWLETDLENPAVQYDAGRDVAGPVNIGLAVSPPEATDTVTQTQTLTQTRLVVYGNATFASNSVLQDQVPDFNVDLFANSVSWLTGQNDLVSIRPKEAAAARQLLLDQNQESLLFTAAVLGLPILVAIAGGTVWWRRK